MPFVVPKESLPCKLKLWVKHLDDFAYQLSLWFHVCKINVILKMAAEVLNYYWYIGLCIEILYVNGYILLMNF